MPVLAHSVVWSLFSVVEFAKLMSSDQSTSGECPDTVFKRAKFYRATAYADDLTLLKETFTRRHHSASKPAIVCTCTGMTGIFKCTALLHITDDNLYAVKIIGQPIWQQIIGFLCYTPLYDLLSFFFLHYISQGNNILSIQNLNPCGLEKNTKKRKSRNTFLERKRISRLSVKSQKKIFFTYLR